MKVYSSAVVKNLHHYIVYINFNYSFVAKLIVAGVFVSILQCDYFAFEYLIPRQRSCNWL